MKNLILILVCLVVVSCADVSPHSIDCVTSDPYGFWGGFWHGLILPFSWIGSLFSHSIAIYALDNNGAWYDTGFVLGCGSIVKSVKSFNVKSYKK